MTEPVFSERGLVTDVAVEPLSLFGDMAPERGLRGVFEVATRHGQVTVPCDARLLPQAGDRVHITIEVVE